MGYYCRRQLASMAVPLQLTIACAIVLMASTYSDITNTDHKRPHPVTTTFDHNRIHKNLRGSGVFCVEVTWNDPPETQ